MIFGLGKFVFSRVRVFALAALILFCAGAVRAGAYFAPEFLGSADAALSRVVKLFSKTDELGLSSGASLADKIAALVQFRGENGPDDDTLLTGSTAEAADALSAGALPPDAMGPTTPESQEEALRAKSPTEDMLLKKLGERREFLDKREEELNNREALLKASEIRITQRIAELKLLEVDLKAKIDQRNEMLVSLKPLVIMYEAMKPKDAAQVFENLEYSTLVELVAAMNPRKVSDVVAVMEPKLASRVTKELATRGKASVTVPDNSAANLDKAAELPDVPKVNP